MRAVWLIARTVLIEAVRRREIYAIVMISVLLIGAVMTVDFFGLRGLTKFYAEVALKVMGLSTAVTAIVLAARQLPREFEARTIYPLLAKPVGRGRFIAGKVLGVMLASAFCLSLFLSVYVAGTGYLGGRLAWGLLAQYAWLQMVGCLVLVTLSLWLSLVVNLDAAITFALVFMATSSVVSGAVSYLYDFAGGFGQAVLVAATYGLPQMGLFDLSEKTVHAEAWAPLDLGTMAAVTAYGAFFSALYAGAAWWCFRRRAL